MRSNDELRLSAEDMRALGYRVIDMIVDHFDRLSEKPVSRKSDRRTLERCLREPIPRRGRDPLDLVGEVQRDVFDNMMHVDHPRFFAFVPSPSNFVGVMADALASAFNVFAGTWIEASGPGQIELVVLDWLREACGLPAAAGGLLVSGGSMANVTALAAARHVKLKDRVEGAVVYYSDQTHSSVERGLRMLGFAAEQLRKVSTDQGLRLDLDALRGAVEEDRSQGRRPFCVVANAGTTNTGAVDPLPELADLCSAEELWLHVDGAYGAAAVLCERGRALLTGLERVDSLSLDPHKWLFQPFEVGCVLVRDVSWLNRTFQMQPEYLEDVRAREEEVNFCNRGIQLTRGFRALKLWLSLKTFGLEAFERAIERGFELAECAEAAVRGRDHWEIVSHAQMGIVAFRFVPEGLPPDAVNELNRQIVEELMADQFAQLSSTQIRGKTVLRFCTINPRTRESDLRETVERLDRMAAALLRARLRS